MPSRRLAWFTQAPRTAQRSLLVAALGWGLDSFDLMLYSLVLAPMMHDLSLSKAQAGMIGSATLIAGAGGGLLFGGLADRYGRVFALRWSVLIYAVFTAACGLSQNLWQLLLFRILLGFGMGGEWASGAALVSETWPLEHRGKALGLVQSAWALGYAAAAITVELVLPHFRWRAVFFVGIVPALLTALLRRTVSEPASWVPSTSPFGGFRELFRTRATIFLTLMNACALFAWWGFNLWVPAYLSLPLAKRGLGLSTGHMTALIVVMQIGMWLGYVTFGVVSDRAGRKPAYLVYLIAASLSLYAYSVNHSAALLLLLGPIAAFFGTGHFSGLGAVTADLYATRIRATAQGFIYNMGRIASAAAPFLVGSWAGTHGFEPAFRLVAAFFGLAALLWIWIPPTGPRSALSRAADHPLLAAASPPAPSPEHRLGPPAV